MADYGVLPKLPKDLEMMHHMLHGNIKKKGGVGMQGSRLYAP